MASHPMDDTHLQGFDFPPAYLRGGLFFREVIANGYNCREREPGLDVGPGAGTYKQSDLDTGERCF